MTKEAKTAITDNSGTKRTIRIDRDTSQPDV